jgi:hypothetical protein
MSGLWSLASGYGPIAAVSAIAVAAGPLMAEWTPRSRRAGGASVRAS